MKINYTILAVGCVLALLAGMIIGFYLGPEKIVTTERVVKVPQITVKEVIKEVPKEIVKVVKEKCICELPKSCNELRQLTQNGRKPELAKTHVFKAAKQIYSGPGQKI